MREIKPGGGWHVSTERRALARYDELLMRWLANAWTPDEIAVMRTRRRVWVDFDRHPAVTTVKPSPCVL
jgi:hypothetical protein